MDLKGGKICRVGTLEIIECPTFSFDKTGEFPSQTIGKSKNKPFLQISYNKLTSLELRQRIHTCLTTELQPSLVIAYMYKVLESIKNELEDDWESYGIRIGSKGQKIGIFDLLDVQFDDSAPMTNTDLTIKDDAKTWLPFILCCAFRITRTTHPDHRTNVLKTFESQTENSIKEATYVIDTIADLNKSWATNPMLTKLFAAIDMYFNKFPSSNYANLRVGTIVTRFRDCAALLSYQTLSKSLGKETIYEPAYWMWSSTLGDELQEMFSQKEETNNPYSYFPYQIDLGIVTKSKYSSTAVPGIHFWANVILAVLGKSRGKNARINDPPNLNELAAFGFVVGYIFSKKREGQMISVAPESEDIAETGEPQIKDPEIWLKFMCDNNWQHTSGMKKYHQHLKTILGETRDNTIGQLIKNMDISENEETIKNIYTS